jgi:lipoprotein-anchoring transpeptidase ErfK/SrfK
MHGWVCVLLLGLIAPALAASEREHLSLEAINAADLKTKTGKGISPILIKAQVLLDRARFSPGVIDGRNGDNLRRATAAFEAARSLKADGALDEEVWAKLNETSSEPVLIEYAIRDEDVKGPFTKEIPEKFEEQAKLDRLGYTGPEELLAEKFHMDQDLLKALNPDKSFDKAGTSIVVANVEADPAKGKPEKLAKIEIDKDGRALRALRDDGSVIAVYPASIGSTEKPAPSGTHMVRTVAGNPTYTYNPEYKFEGVKAQERFLIKPGPNNPVGTVWIDLSVESFGIHGTSEPEKVGKAYSHGCVRLTNWDAEELAKMVQKGTPVTFVE